MNNKKYTLSLIAMIIGIVGSITLGVRGYRLGAECKELLNTISDMKEPINNLENLTKDAVGNMADQFEVPSVAQQAVGGLFKSMTSKVSKQIQDAANFGLKVGYLSIILGVIAFIAAILMNRLRLISAITMIICGALPLILLLCYQWKVEVVDVISMTIPLLVAGILVIIAQQSNSEENIQTASAV